MNYLTCQEGNSDKFYEITAKGCVVSMRYGRTGSDGVSSTKSFGSPTEATKFVDKTVAEKLKKGYKASNVASSGAVTTAASTVAENSAAASKKRSNVTTSAIEPVSKKTKVVPTMAESSSEPSHYLECVEGGSNKFYEIKQNILEVDIRFGKCGTDGQHIVKSFDTIEQATKFVTKTVAEKEKKGYVSQSTGGESKGVKCAWDSWDADHAQPTKTKLTGTTKAPAQSGAVKRGRDDEDDDEDDEEEEEDGTMSSANDVKYLTCTEGNSDKFYEISATNCTVAIRYGRSGTNGQSSEKQFKIPAEALKFVDKTVAEKMKKGYKLRASCQCEAGCTFLHGHAARRSRDEEPAPTTVFDFLAILIAEKKKLNSTEKHGTVVALKTASNVPLEYTAPAKLPPKLPTPSDSVRKMCYYLECTEGASNKFYEIKQNNLDVNIRFGKCGTEGQSLVKSFDTADQATNYLTKTVAEKEKKGYVTQTSVLGGTEILPFDFGQPMATKPITLREAFGKAPTQPTTITKSTAASAGGPVKAPTKRAAAAAAAKGPLAKGAAGAVVNLNEDSDDNGKGDDDNQKAGASSNNSNDVKYLTCTEGNSDKFYEISATNCTVSIRYGRSGTNGQSSEKQFKIPAEALKFVDKTVAEKMKKGYALRPTCKCEEGCTFLHGHTVHRSCDQKPAPASSTKTDIFDFLANLLAEKKKLSFAEKQETLVALKTANSVPVGSSSTAPVTAATVPEPYKHTADFGAIPAPKPPTIKEGTSCVMMLECHESGSNKFYEIVYDGDCFVSGRYGKVGATGVVVEKTLKTPAEAVKHVEKTLREKLNKGYTYVALDESSAEKRAHATVKTPVVKETPATVVSTAASSAAEASSSNATTSFMIYLECHEGGSNKFYEMVTDDNGTHITIRYGKVGADGMLSEKSFKTATECTKFVDKTVAEKLKKGYKPVQKQ